SKPRHGQARYHAAFVRKPFDERRHRHDVTEAQTKAAQYSKSKIEQSEMSMRLAGQYHPQTVTNTADHGHSPRPRPFHPQSARESGKTKHEYRQFKGKGDL